MADFTGEVAMVPLALVENQCDLASRDSVAKADVLIDASIYRSVVDALYDGVVITQQDDDSGESCFVFVNPAFAALAGCSASDILGKTLQSTEHAYINRKLLCCLAESHHQMDTVSGEVVVGKNRILHLQSIPVCDPSGQTSYRVAILHDITGRKSLEEAVRRNERLTGIGLLAAGIAHEINNPTGSALLAAETALAIKDHPEAGEQLTACLENIVASTDRCGRIVRTLLRYSRDESTEKLSCSINDVAEQAIDLTRPYAERQRAVVRLERDPDVPLVPMNPLEIELVLVNLIRNALEAGSEDAEVLVRTERTEGAVRVLVHDNGRGMSCEQIKHIFDPLYTTRKFAGGSGLGLSIAHGIIQRHRGHIEVLSQSGKGTVVTVDLPITAGSSDAEDQSK